jgi:hypothetical protein
MMATKGSENAETDGPCFAASVVYWGHSRALFRKEEMAAKRRKKRGSVLRLLRFFAAIHVVG